MAAKHLSMAEELLNVVTEPFTKVLCLLHDSRTITIENFKRQHTELMKYHQLDSSILLTPDKKHPTTIGIFEVYRKKTGLNAAELKEMLIDWMCDKLTNCMAIALNQSKQTFAEWLQRITLKDDFVPDELTIYCLSHFLNIHTLVYTSNFCWSTLMNQFKFDKDELYEKSDIKLVYVGHNMYAELKHIRQPRPQLTHTVSTTPPGADNTKKRSSAGRCGRKVTNRGDKPRSKQGRKSTPPPLPPPPVPRPSRRNRCNINYLQLNDGLEKPAVTSPKTKKKKPYSPPPRAGPSASRQAANKKNRNKLDLKLLMEKTPDTEKLPDIVSNSEQQETFNAVTDNQTTTSREADSTLATNDGNGEFNGVTKTPLSNFSTPVTPVNTELLLETIALVTPENAEVLPETVLDTNDTITPALVGHDTATTTDEEEAAEALLALCNLPDMDDEEDGSDDNANLMPIGGPSMSININPVEVKLGADDVNQAIQQLPQESRFEASTDTLQSSAKGQIVGTDPQTSAQQEDSAPNKPVDSNSPPNLPTKGTLKVKNYGLKKSRQTKRIYRCQKCGCKE